MAKISDITLAQLNPAATAKAKHATLAEVVAQIRARLSDADLGKIVSSRLDDAIVEAKRPLIGQGQYQTMSHVLNTDGREGAFFTYKGALDALNDLGKADLANASAPDKARLQLLFLALLEEDPSKQNMGRINLERIFGGDGNIPRDWKPM